MKSCNRDDLDYLPVLASLPPQQTTFEFLVGAWKRLNATRQAVIKKVASASHSHVQLTYNNYRVIPLLIRRPRLKK